MKSLLGAIGGLDRNGLGSSIDVRDGAIGCFEPVFADLIEFVCGLLTAIDGVVYRNFAAHGYTMGGIHRAFFCIFGSVHGYVTGVVKGVLCAVLGLDHDGL